MSHKCHWSLVTLLTEEGVLLKELSENNLKNNKLKNVLEHGTDQIE